MAVNYRDEASRAAERYGIPADLFLRQIGAESTWDPSARSPKGAIGLGQLMPGTAKELGVDPNDPIQNLDGAARYMRQQYDTFGDWKTAAAAYNAGPGNVRKHGGVPPFKETQNYVEKLFGGGGDVGGGDAGGYGQTVAPYAPSGGQGGGQTGGQTGYSPETVNALMALAMQQQQPQQQMPQIGNALDPAMFMSRRRFG